VSTVSASERLFGTTQGKHAVGASDVTKLVQMEAVVEATERKRP
jgi:hypothetical protein